jgi:broad specificity phosphatase PhoE
MVTITYFVHGTTTDNEQKLATGWLPGELSNKGVEQARQLAKIVQAHEFDNAICSDLHRAIQTAEIVFGEDTTLRRDERLREIDYGDWNGKAASMVKDHMENYIGSPFPGGESYRDVEKRMRSLCNDLKEKYDGQHIALMAHQAPQLALEVILNNKTWQQAIEEDWRKTGAYQPGWNYIIP